MANNFDSLNLTELHTKVVELKKKLAESRFDSQLGKLTDTTTCKRLKKEVARVLTRINQAKNA